MTKHYADSSTSTILKLAGHESSLRVIRENKQMETTINIDVEKPITKSRLRVLLFTNSVAEGGMEKHVLLLAKYLDRQRFEVFGISPNWAATTKFTRELGEVTDYSTTITPDRRYGLWSELKECYRLFRQARRWKIQVMHIHGTTYRGQVMAMLTGRLAGIHKIYITEHLVPEKPLPTYEKFSRNLFSRLVSGIVCVSEKNYASRSAYIYTPESRTLIVNNGVDVNDFNPISAETLDELRAKYDIPAHASIVGTVVRFEPEKGLEYLLQAMVQIRQACPESYLLMVGDGSLRTELEKEVARLGLSEYTRFAGFQTDPRPFLGLIDAFVLPVPFGSASIGLLEAMAMHKAVVITFGGNGEAVVDGETGFCAEPRNPDSIAQAVIKILQNPELKRRLGNAARQYVELKFSAERVACELGNLYEQA